MAIEPDTVITLNGVPARLAEIKPGGHATVRQIDGLTTRVDIRSKKERP